MSGNHLEKARELLASARKRHRRKPIGKPPLNGNGKGHSLQCSVPLYPDQGAPIKATKELELTTRVVPSGLPDSYVASDGRLNEILTALDEGDRVAVDLETTGLYWRRDKIRLVSITTSGGKTFVVDAFKTDIRPVLARLSTKQLIAHNALFDVLFLMRAGMPMPERITCTMNLARILWAGKLRPGSGDKNIDHGLRSVVKRALDEDLDKGHQKADWSSPHLTADMVRYAAKDSSILLPLLGSLEAHLSEVGGLDWVLNIEERLTKAIIGMSLKGLPIDVQTWEKCVADATEEKALLLRELDSHVTGPIPEKFRVANQKNKNIPDHRKKKINWSSNVQVGWVLKELYGIRLPSTPSGQPSIGENALTGVDHGLAQLILRFNKVKDYAAKFGAVLEKRVDDGRIYADWRQCEADTGRMSCANPNLQGLPRKGGLRRAIAAPEGFSLIVSDLSQIEIRALAALSGDEVLRAAFEEGADIHRSVAATVLGEPEGEVTYEQRTIAKSIVFGMMYGQGVSGLRNTIENRLGREFPESEARGYWSRFFDAYPGVGRWRDAESGRFDGGARTTRTIKGRRRVDVNRKTQRWNTPIQGSAADALKNIAVKVYEHLDELPDAELLGLVHDEVLLLVPEEKAEHAKAWLTEMMNSAADEIINHGLPPERRIPIKADTQVCTSWGEKA